MYDAYYDPDAPTVDIVPEGQYTAHIVGLEKKNDVIIRKKFLADIYNPKYKLAPNNGEYAGEVVKGGGIFRFKKPPDNKKHLRDRKGGGNVQYKEFLDAADVELQYDEVPGTGKKVAVLPELLEEDVFGTPVVIEIRHRDWFTRDGRKMTDAEGFIVSQWSDGDTLDPAEEKVDDGLPF